MLYYLKTNLKSRVLVAFLAIGFIPYILLTIYFNYWVHQTLIKEQTLTLQTQAKHSKNLIQNRLSQLQKELEFIASLEVFDDMITEDLDSQILRLLEKKANIREYEKLTLYAINTKKRVIASSDKNSLGKQLHILDKDSFVKNSTLFIIMSPEKQTT